MEKLVIQNVRPSQLVCHLVRGSKRFFWMKNVSLEKTPHFAYLKGDPSPYRQFLDRFLGRPLGPDYSLEKFAKLASDLAYLKPPYEHDYILVQELWPGKFLILDGLHRAAILKFRGHKKFPVAVRKKWLSRIRSILIPFV